MPGTGGTPISTFFSTTAGVSPSAGQLVNGELFINISDGKIFYKNSGGVVKLFGAGIAWLGVQTANFSAVNQSGYPVDTTSAAITALLPATPSAGDAISFVDYAGTFQTHALTIDPNGGKINGVAATVIVNTPRAAVDLVYIDSTQGWVAYAGFASSPIASYSVNYLVVAGGGGGGNGGSAGGGAGGGAGGVLPGTATFSAGTAYTITIGAGGAGSATGVSKGSNGVNSSISSVATAVGGGGGGSDANQPGASGGSGGGGAEGGGTGGSGTGGQGNAGGNGLGGGLGYPGGGGGGGGAVGQNAPNLSTGGNGGIGVSSSISGSAAYYGGGGGGSCYGGTGGTGGNGGGGAGSTSGGTANTGGGAGGTVGVGSGYSGGSGIVIISYLGSQRGTGGTVTSSGGYTIHTFTSSGTYNA